ncbi:MAG: carboxypeptidase-like regulatory domain-containing protein [Bacteroidales bacterium]|nr:carboxypeptidase-like regulatory domain-containing protein [Bacteroidales bacterium]
MFQKIKEKKQQLIRFLFGSFTATALMFTFQACYGMPQRDIQVNIQGTVTNAETGEPVEGLSIKLGEYENCIFETTTDADGHFRDPNGERIIQDLTGYLMSIRDIDSTEHGEYLPWDTIVDAHGLSFPLDIKVKPKNEESR